MEVEETLCRLLVDALVTSIRLHEANACIVLNVAVLLSSLFVICVGNYVGQHGCGSSLSREEGKGRHNIVAIVSLCRCRELVRPSGCVNLGQCQHSVLHICCGDPPGVRLTEGRVFVILSVLIAEMLAKVPLDFVVQLTKWMPGTSCLAMRMVTSLSCRGGQRSKSRLVRSCIIIWFLA